jgi:hypothetical protein
MRDPAFFEHLFPAAGPWSEVLQADRLNRGPKAETVDRAPNKQLVPSKSAFTVAQVANLNKAFELLGDDEAAKGTLAGIIQFCQIKDDVAGW